MKRIISFFLVLILMQIILIPSFAENQGMQPLDTSLTNIINLDLESAEDWESDGKMRATLAVSLWLDLSRADSAAAAFFENGILSESYFMKDSSKEDTYMIGIFSENEYSGEDLLLMYYFPKENYGAYTILKYCTSVMVDVLKLNYETWDLDSTAVAESLDYVGEKLNELGEEFVKSARDIGSSENEEKSPSTSTPKPTPTKKPVNTPKPVYTPKPQKSSSSSGSKKKQTYYEFPDDDDYYMDEDEWLAWHKNEYDNIKEALDMYYWLYG